MESLAGKVLVYSVEYGTGWDPGFRVNEFFLIERETPRSVVAHKIAGRLVRGTPIIGYEVPDLNELAAGSIGGPDPKHIVTLRFYKRLDERGKPCFVGQGMRVYVWNGLPLRLGYPQEP